MEDYIQLYNIWVLGRSINDLGQQFPIDAKESIKTHVWRDDFKKVVADYHKITVLEVDEELNCNSEIFKDATVILFSVDIRVSDFKKYTNKKMDLKNDEIQESISYFTDYKFNTVAQRITNFKK